VTTTTTAQRSFPLGIIRLVSHELNGQRCFVELGYRQTLGVGNRRFPAVRQAFFEQEWAECLDVAPKVGQQRRCVGAAEQLVAERHGILAVCPP